MKQLKTKSLKNLKALLLAAGFGSRLKPLTDFLPKCLMPINGRPLLEYWFFTLNSVGIQEVLVNVHYRADDVYSFLNRPHLAGRVKSVYEPKLLGTAGTIRANIKFFDDTTSLVIHADNWCQCNFQDFIDYHFKMRPKDCLITMMTFTTNNPMECGIVEIDDECRVKALYEKLNFFAGTRANAAIYIMEPEVLEWIKLRPSVSDISTQVLPHFIGKIATWHNNQVHRDIGSIESLKKAQFDFNYNNCLNDMVVEDDWSKAFAQHKVHNFL